MALFVPSFLTSRLDGGKLTSRPPATLPQQKQCLVSTKQEVGQAVVRWILWRRKISHVPTGERKKCIRLQRALVTTAINIAFLVEGSAKQISLYRAALMTAVTQCQWEQSQKVITIIEQTLASLGHNPLFIHETLRCDDAFQPLGQCSIQGSLKYFFISRGAPT